MPYRLSNQEMMCGFRLNTAVAAFRKRRFQYSCCEAGFGISKGRQ